MAILQIPITKAKGFIEVDTTTDLPDDVYAEALLQGLKVLLNRGASKITKETYPDEAELKAEAMTKAEEQLDMVKKGTIKFTGSSKKSKESGAVMTEARRLAKNIIKDEMKRNKIKISHVEPKEITAAANALLAEDPSIIETAKANLEARQATPVKIDIKSLIKESPKLVKAAEEKKAKAKAERPLSKTQAAKVAPRTKPGTRPSA
jgi:hypothetical protein